MKPEQRSAFEKALRENDHAKRLIGEGKPAEAVKHLEHVAEEFTRLLGQENVLSIMALSGLAKISQPWRSRPRCLLPAAVLVRGGKNR